MSKPATKAKRRAKLHIKVRRRQKVKAAKLKVRREAIRRALHRTTQRPSLGANIVEDEKQAVTENTTEVEQTASAAGDDALELQEQELATEEEVTTINEGPAGQATDEVQAAPGTMQAAPVEPAAAINEPDDSE